MMPSSAVLESSPGNVPHAKPRGLQNEPLTQIIATGTIYLGGIHIRLSSQGSNVSRNNPWKHHLLVLSLIPNKDILVPSNASTQFRHWYKRKTLIVQGSTCHGVQTWSNSWNSVGLHLQFWLTPSFHESLAVKKWLALGLKGGGRFCGTWGWEMLSFLILTAHRLKSKWVQNRRGSPPVCASYKTGYLERTAGASLCHLLFS